MPFSKYSQYPVVGRISAKDIFLRKLCKFLEIFVFLQFKYNSCYENYVTTDKS